MVTAIKTREQWLIDIKNDVEVSVFGKHGYKLPKKINLTVSEPKGKKSSAKGGKVIGQCLSTDLSTGGFNEIYITPDNDGQTVENSVKVIGIVIHELIHAYDNCKNGHNHVFRKIALTVGLQGKMTATTHTEELKEVIDTIVKDIGEYPHKKLDYKPRKKQSTRLVKINCSGYGVEYNDFNELLQAMKSIVINYNYFRKKVKKFDRIIDDAVDDYADIINAVYTKR